MNAAMKMRVLSLADERLWTGEAPRVHLVGTIVQLQHNQTWQQGALDDGTGTIEFRLFSEKEACKVGDLIRLIGRPATYGSARYISADIIKVIDNPAWLRLWQLEVEAPKAAESPPKDPRDSIVTIIRALDEGQGADVLSVIEKSGLPDAESLIERLKSDGEIFETRPGKVKVLE